MINDHSKGFVAKTVLLNDRMNAYKAYIRYAQQKGYTVISLEDFYKLPDKRSAGKKHFVLRHDVDHPGSSTRKMFEIERECEVTSTYYFRFSTIDKKLIEDMRDAGFSVGFHFETISDYIKETNCTDKSQIDLGEMRSRFKKELERFEGIVGFKTQSCCAHGDDMNKKLGISNNVVTEGEDLSQFGLLFEAYDANLYQDFVDCHIMDRKILYNYGFAYKDNPIDAVNTGYTNIIFLSHPSNWKLGMKSYLGSLRGFLLGRATYTTDREFVRIRR